MENKTCKDLLLKLSVIIGIQLLAMSNFLMADLPSAKEKSQLNYAELAQISIQQALLDLEVGLMAFDADTLPHDAKLLRKSIGNVRGMLDLFAYAFHPEQVEGEGYVDHWQEFRKRLDKGYGIFGQFKDIFDRQFVPVAEANYLPYAAEVEAKRKKCQSWKKSFTKKERLNAYKKFSYQAQNKNYIRPNLSRFYWGAFVDKEVTVNEVIVIKNISRKPSQNLTGMENVALLMKGILRLALKDYDHAIHVGSLLTHHNSELFHDFRKRVRTVVKANIKAFPEIVRVRDAKTNDSYNVLLDLVERFGSVNDKVTTLHNMLLSMDPSFQEGEDLDVVLARLKTNNDVDVTAAESLIPEIEQGLQVTKEWLEEVNLPMHLEQLEASLL